ncbi:hypothetical protein NDU88_006827 [Pleurodeles waltl]|uniref:Uncharacterized protein n=1 Tax=Pleurodeles waltl TaxID=8319 RepID=A0AAV7VNR0_PLEWA|nr:hypothetical protein NDU88_006827 [Pleurodeles waltl]
MREKSSSKDSSHRRTVPPIFTPSPGGGLRSRCRSRKRTATALLDANGEIRLASEVACCLASLARREFTASALAENGKIIPSMFLRYFGKKQYPAWKPDCERVMFMLGRFPLCQTNPD